jgi:hypothetical protein
MVIGHDNREKRDMSVKALLRTHEDELDIEKLSAVIEAAYDCAAHCLSCADACLEEGDPHLNRCIRADLDCADVCTATAKVVARAGASGIPWLELVRVCMETCASCAEECEQHDHDHCRICAEACRRCEEACRQLVDSAG